MRRVFELAAYRRLLAAYTLNELAFSVGSLTLSYLVYHRTGSAVGATGFYLCAQFVPALLAPWLVARLDQRPARRVLPALYAGEGLIFAAQAVLVSHFSIAPVLALALLDGWLALTARPLARATTVAVTSAAGLLREGNAVTNSFFSVSFMVGPAIGGVVVAAGGARAALLINVGLFALIALTLLTAAHLPVPAPAARDRGSRLRAAFGYVRASRPIRSLLGVQAAALLFFTTSIPVEVVFAQRSLHAGAGGYGALLAAWGAGAVAGSAIYARWRGLHARALIALSAVLIGIGLAGMAAAPSIAVAVAAAVVAGVGNGVEAVAARTALQEQTDERWMSLVMSFTESLSQAMPGLGILLGGTIAALAGPRPALAVGATGSLLIAAVSWAVLQPHQGFAHAAADPPPL